LNTFSKAIYYCIEKIKNIILIRKMVDKIVRSERKTLSVHIGKNGDVIVRAPLRMPEPMINRSATAGRKPSS
jgi:hypothetical protein